MAYLAYVLDDESREVLLKMYPPKFPDVKANHITKKYPISFFEMCYYLFTLLFQKKEMVYVTGYIADESLEALIAQVHGANRDDGKTFHITLSLNASEGRVSAESNELIANKTPTYFRPIFFRAKLQVCF